MNDSAEDRAEPLRPQEVERLRTGPPRQGLAPELSTIPSTLAPAAAPGSPLQVEWEFYRRIVGRLLSEGHEGKWLLIKNEEIVGVWDKEAEADAVRRERFLMQPVLMKQVLVREPVLRIGYNRLCRS